MSNWDDTKIFLAVARAESLSGAAPRLRMDVSTLSRRIARLEAELGAALFVKSSQGYVLTDRGQRLFDEAASIESAMQRALSPEPTAGPGLSGQIRIGAPDGCATFILPQVCGQIQADNPGLEVQILSLPRVVNLSRREADLAIAVSAPTAGRLTVQKMTDYKLHLAASDEYLSQNAPIHSAADLRKHRANRRALGWCMTLHCPSRQSFMRF